MYKNINVEAEHNELILKNSNGDHAIIPANKRTWVKHKLAKQDYKAIDELISTLPVATQYANDGSWYPSWLNPKNWGVKDYTDKGDFNTAYSKARQEENEEFLWNDKRYKTDIKKSNKLNEIISNNIYPYGNFSTSESDYKYDYDELQKLRYYDDKGNYTPNKKFQREEFLKITKNEKGESLYDNFFSKGKSSKPGHPKDLEASYDALSLHQNQPQKYNSFNKSEYSPSKSKDKNKEYFSFNEKYTKQIENDLLLYDNRDFLESKENKRQVKNSTVAGASLRNFQYSKGNDEKGEYVAYYDKNDYGNILDVIPNSNPFEIYGRIYVKDYGDGKKKRMYYSDNELEKLNPQNKDFDTLALQRELSNRGYQLPKSTKTDGSFDGIWGKETEQSLLDLQNKLKK